MTEDTIAWHFQEKREKSFYINKDISAGKYTFNKTMDALSEQEFQEKRRNDESRLLERKEFLLTVSWNISSDNAEKIETITREELERILEIITLHTNHLFQIGAFIHTSSDKKKSLSFESTLESPYSELTEEILTNSVKINEKIDSIEDKNKASCLRYALTWYSRGLQEHDTANAYASYWMGFETLSFWFEPLASQDKCSECGQLVYEKSIGKRMREFVAKLEIENIDKKTIDKLYTTRSKLFHRSIDEITKEDLRILQNLLKNCIFTCANQSTINGSIAQI